MLKSPSTLKVILLGNGSVGKSSIVQRLVSDGFERIYKQTVGFDCFERLITIKGTHSVVLQVWDIGGQSIASTMLPQYIHGSSVIMLCYDITDSQSFDDLDEWFEKTLQKIDAENARQPTMYLLGNKIDLKAQRQVSSRAHDTWMNDKRIAGGFFVSARNGKDVLRVFVEVSAKMMGIPMTDYDLEFFDKVIVAEVTRSDTNEGRTSIADQIEDEDRALEAAKRRDVTSSSKKCAIS